MNQNETTFHLGNALLSPDTAFRIERKQIRAELDKEARAKISAGFNAVAEIVAGEKTVYGINTGFGPLCTTAISEKDTRKLQYNILRSHSVGVGDPVPESITRLMLILKVHALAQGFSGISIKTLERIMWHIENNVTPLVPSQGSVGASGDLAPLAHLFLPLIGQGKVIYKGQIVNTGEMFKNEGLKPLDLGPKEGLALINGTQFMTAYGLTALDRLHTCLESADIISAMTLEALLGSAKPFIPELHALRPYAGSKHVAHRLKTLLENSEMVASHTPRWLLLMQIAEEFRIPTHYDVFRRFTELQEMPGFT